MNGTEFIKAKTNKYKNNSFEATFNIVINNTTRNHVPMKH
jgi:hypothetical protein